MTLGLLLILVIPLALAVLAVIANSQMVMEAVSSLRSKPLPPPPDWLERIPLAGQQIAGSWRETMAKGPESALAKAAPYLGTLLEWLIGKIGGFGMLLVQFLLTLLISAILYMNGEQAANGVRLFGRRLAGARGEGAVELAGKAIRGVALGVVVTALLQTAAAGIGLAVAGVPAAAVLILIAFVLCIAQVGPMLVMLGAIAWLYWTGQTMAGTLLLLYTIPVGAVDNIIRPVLIRKGVDLPLLLIMSGVIGGLIVFGLVGVFIGPVVLAVAYTLLADWVEQREATQP